MPRKDKAPDFERELARSLIAEPLLSEARENPGKTFDVIIELNLDYRDGRDAARKRVTELVTKEKGETTLSNNCVHPFVFAKLTGRNILVLADASVEGPGRIDHPIHRIWKDHDVHSLLTESVRTIKADAARISFSATGRDVVWAVIDSGVDGKHPHFRTLANLELNPPLQHMDYIRDANHPEIGSGPQKLADGKGHGTHVAGIIAGLTEPSKTQKVFQMQSRQDTRTQNIVWDRTETSANFSGVAPETKIVSMRVLDNNGVGKSSYIIAAIEEVLRINDFGRRNLIHGVNLSLGYWFDPLWFACGQSPLCTAVNRLVRSGVVVVAAAGNAGYVETQAFRGMSAVPAAGQMISINDPGNADLAITVGSVHRNMPHVYGVSFFSSKGPTGDGRRKPDLVAPGERIISCATGNLLKETEAAPKSKKDAYFVESSGTSMAAPHVSGAIAAFLSVRREFLGQPERVKQIFMQSATDLARDSRFQGAGVVDLMRAIQSV